MKNFKNQREHTEDTQQESQRRQAEISALLEGTRAVLAYREFKDSARAIFDSCKNLIGATAGYVALLSKDGAENEVLFLDSGGLPCTVDPTLPMPIRGLRNEAYISGKAVYCNDFSESEWMKFMPEGHAKLDNVLFVPLLSEGKAVGLLGLANKQGGFNDNDARMASAFGGLAAISLLNSRTIESLKDSEERFRSVAQTASDAIISSDCRGNFVFWNSRAEAVFGYSYDEVVGKPLTVIMPERFREAHQNGMQRVVSIGKSSIIGKTVEVTGQRKDGSEFPVELSLATWKTTDGVFFTGIIRDITERKRAEEALRKAHDELEIRVRERTAELAKANGALQAEIKERMWAEEELRRVNRAHKTLSRSNQTLIRATEETGLLHEICRGVVETGGYRFAWVGFAELDEKKTVRPVAQAGYEEGYLENANITWADNERGRGPTGTAIRTGKPGVAKNILADPNYIPWRAEAIKRGYASAIALPLIANGKPFGALNIYATEPDAFGEEEIALLTELADDMAYGITALRLHAEHKKTEEMQRKLSSAVEKTADIVIITNRDGIIEYVNPAFEKLTGYASDETIGNTPRLLKSGKQDNKFYERLWGSILSGRVFRGELINKKKNGELYYAEKTITPLKDDLGNITNFVSVDKDITERKKAEEEQERLNRHNKLILDSVGEGIYGVDMEGKTTFINPAAASMLGYEAEELIGKPAHEAMHHTKQDGTPYPREKCPTCAVLQTGAAYSMVDEVFWKKDGTSFPVEYTCTPVRERGKIAGAVVVFRDVTERKKAEETKLENERLAAADKAKSEFLASMSHELRTPLNASIGFSELLTQGVAGELSEKQKHFVDNILTSSQFLLTLINDILDLSKIEAGKVELVPEKMSLPVTIKETLSLIKEKAMKHNVLLKTEFNSELEFIEADKQRFKQILFNLLSNAVKFSKEEGGTVTIRAKKEGDMAQISISDTGIGIKEENVGRLFHKFEQLDSGISRHYGGTGLGLAITKQLVEQHGGKLWAKSTYGEGSTFTFILPVEAKKEKKDKNEAD